MDIKKGDVIKTDAGDNTVVLDVNGEDATLFTGTQFIKASGIYEYEDKIVWGSGMYFIDFNSIADDTAIRENVNKDFKELKTVFNEIVDGNYELYVKAILSIEMNINDEELLSCMYDKFMENDPTALINDGFEEIAYDIEHENSFDEMIFDDYEKSVDLAHRIDDFMYELNPNSYHNKFEGTRDEIVTGMIKDIEKGELNDILYKLNEIEKDYYTENDVVSGAKDLKERLSKYILNEVIKDEVKDNDKRPSLLSQLKESKKDITSNSITDKKKDLER